MLNTLSYPVFIAVIAIFQLLPRRAQLVALSSLLRAALLLMPKYKKIAHKNLMLVFPKMSLMERRRVLREHCQELATLVVDFLNIESVTPEWTNKHVEIDITADDKAILEGGGGMLFLSGHQGAFELLPSIFHHVLKRRLIFVVRTLKQPRIDKWWNAKREFWGSKTLARDGATRGLIKALRANECVGLLFDQNVREANGVFVDWFGRLACTTRAVGMLAAKLEIPVFATYAHYKADDATTGERRLQFQLRHIPLEDIYSDVSMQTEQKEMAILSRCVREVESSIRQHPASWFWLHRRWKTAPKGSSLEGFYEPESLQGVEV
jgi:Kdo2-lipid IVA lauroyltransferase/acyltransferase